LIDWFGATLFEYCHLFVLKLDDKIHGQTPRWRFQFDEMKGIIDRPDLLAVPVLSKKKPHRQ
jgi:hypothetical protein